MGRYGLCFISNGSHTSNGLKVVQNTTGPQGNRISSSIIQSLTAFQTEFDIYHLLVCKPSRIVTMANQGGNLKSTSINEVKNYSLAGQNRTLATWLQPKKIRALGKDKSPVFKNFIFNHKLSVTRMHIFQATE